MSYPLRTLESMNTSEPADFTDEMDRLIRTGLLLARVHDAKQPLAEVVDALVDIDGMGAGRPRFEHPHQRLQTGCLSRLATLWEQGWQPLDVAHVVRRQCNARVALLLICAMDAQHTSSDSAPFAPPDWTAQLISLSATIPTAQADRLRRQATNRHAEPFAAWQRADRISLPDLLEDALRLMSTLIGLGPLASIAPPPSRWSRSVAAAAPLQGDRQAVSAKVLTTVRGLLAKAESSSFAEEAEAFATKAQEMMARHSIDVAMLDRDHGADLAAGIVSQRFHLDQPYANEKVHLLSVVGAAIRVRIVFSDAYAIAHAVGFPDDLAMTDVLYTSLLVQASRALTGVSDNQPSKGQGKGQGTGQGKGHGTGQGPGAHGRSPSFRRAFWLSYASRIGERLEAASARAEADGQATYGDALLPTLTERTKAIDHKIAALFGPLRPMKPRSVDAEGWYAGRDAADQASLHASTAQVRR
jgi:hypothetical protein